MYKLHQLLRILTVLLAVAQKYVRIKCSLHLGSHFILDQNQGQIVRKLFEKGQGSLIGVFGI